MPTSPILSLPVIGPLHPFEWVRPAGNTEMKVTQTAAQHAAKKINGVPRAMALDIGDGAPDLDTIYSPHAGVVAQALTVGSANLSIDFPIEGVKWRIVLAHNTLPHPVKVGQVLVDGAVVGRMGSTSTPDMPVPLHLHIQVGWWNGTIWVWVDPWPLFAQNIIGEDMLQGTNPIRKSNRKATTFGNAKLRKDPSTDNPEWTRVAGELELDFEVTGKPVPAGSADVQWYSGMYLVNSVIQRFYVHNSTVGTLVPVEKTDCSVQIKTATDPLNAEIATLQGRISGIKTKVAANAADVAND